MWAAAVTQRTVVVALACVLLLAGCTGVRTLHFALEPKPDMCQASEVRMSWFATQLAVVCFGADGKAIGFAGTQGQPLVSVPLAVLGAGSTVAGAMILGTSATEAARLMQGIVPSEVAVKATIKADPEQLRQVQEAGKQIQGLIP